MKTSNNENTGHLNLDILPDLVGYNLRRTQIAYYQDYVKTISKPKTSPTQFSVLVLIDANPGISQTELGNVLGMARAATMVVVDKLQNRHWLTRNKSKKDGRMHALQLTSAGKTALKKLKKEIVQFDQIKTSPLTSKEKKELVWLLLKLRN